MFSLSFFTLSTCSLLFIAFNVVGSLAFDMSRQDNLAVYWGQNSLGATNPDDTANFQQAISSYCQDDTINAIPIAFVDSFFSTGGLPSLDLSNTCSVAGNGALPGTALPDCSFLAADIEACQAAGKIVTISLGGGAGDVGFTSDAEGEAFATTIWNIFLGGSSDTRPFGSAVLDGVDLDIEGGGSTGYAAFVTALRSLADSDTSKQYFVTGAPQCPYPDANLGSVINDVGFDAVYVQFYNNYCELTEFSNPNDWNFESWDNWAKTQSPNPNVKVYIGAPASSSAAGSGYVDATTLGNIALETLQQYSSFGGIMLWDASQAYANDRFDLAAKSALTGAGGSSSSTSTSSTTARSPTTTSTSTRMMTSTAARTTSAGSPSTSTSSTPSASPSQVSTTDCAAVPAWSSTAIYTGGNQVTYQGNLYTAAWWTESDVPGGSAGVWTDDGACTGGAYIAVTSTSSSTGGAFVAVTPTSSTSEASAPEETDHHHHHHHSANHRRASRLFRH